MEKRVVVTIMSGSAPVAFLLAETHREVSSGVTHIGGKPVLAMKIYFSVLKFS